MMGMIFEVGFCNGYYMNIFDETDILKEFLIQAKVYSGYEE